MEKLTVVRGMRDILPSDMPAWQHLEGVLRGLMEAYGYSEIRMPLVEKTALFKRSIGEVTDIVEKEMYTFEDKSGDLLTLRPEGTAQCVRAALEANLMRGQSPRLWYMGPMFRRENPQKGRYRQFYQFGVEALGLSGPDIDVEQILIQSRLWRILGLDKNIRLEINTLGDMPSRERYRKELVNYLTKHQDSLDQDSRRRLETNPLRILDSKNLDMADLLLHAPKLLDYLNPESQAHFTEAQKRLDDVGISYTVNPRIVRGLDYYSHMVYEWVTDELGSQNAVSAGGRYDGLVKQLGGTDMPATGFALGMERILLLLNQKEPTFASRVDAYLVMVGEKAQNLGFSLAETWRDALPNLRLMVHCGGGNFKAQFKRADRSGARFALILGDEEADNQTIGIKFLREDKPQETMAITQVEGFFKKALKTDFETVV